MNKPVKGDLLKAVAKAVAKAEARLAARLQAADTKMLTWIQSQGAMVVPVSSGWQVAWTDFKEEKSRTVHLRKTVFGATIREAISKAMLGEADVTAKS